MAAHIVVKPEGIPWGDYEQADDAEYFDAPPTFQNSVIGYVSCNSNNAQVNEIEGDDNPQPTHHQDQGQKNQEQHGGERKWEEKEDDASPINENESVIDASPQPACHIDHCENEGDQEMEQQKTKGSRPIREPLTDKSGAVTSRAIDCSQENSDEGLTFSPSTNTRSLSVSSVTESDSVTEDKLEEEEEGQQEEGNEGEGWVTIKRKTRRPAHSVIENKLAIERTGIQGPLKEPQQAAPAQTSSKKKTSGAARRRKKKAKGKDNLERDTKDEEVRNRDVQRRRAEEQMSAIRETEDASQREWESFVDYVCIFLATFVAIVVLSQLYFLSNRNESWI